MAEEPPEPPPAILRNVGWTLDYEVHRAPGAIVLGLSGSAWIISGSSRRVDDDPGDDDPGAAGQFEPRQNRFYPGNTIRPDRSRERADPCVGIGVGLAALAQGDTGDELTEPG